MSKTQIIILVESVVFLVVIFEFIRRKKIREEYALLWIVLGVFGVVISIWYKGQFLLAKLLGIYYPPAALFLIAFGIVLIMLLHFSVIVTRLTKMNETLVQEIAILKYELGKNEKEN